MRRPILTTALEEQRSALLHRLERLPLEAWAQPCPLPSLAPGVIRLEEPVRTVRDLVSHMLVVDGLAIDRAPLRPWSSLGLEVDGGWDRRRLGPFLDLPPDELVATLERSGERLRRMLSATPPAVVHLNMPGSGAPPLTTQIARRVLHEWIHERDIADRGMSQPRAHLPAPSPAVAEAISDAVLELLPRDVLPHAGADHGVVRLEVVLGSADGQLVARTWGADFTRKHYGPRVTAEADARIRCSAATLAMMVSGRRDRILLDGLVEIDGDRDLGRAVVDAVTSPAESVPCQVVDATLSA